MFKRIVGCIVLAGCFAVVAPQAASAVEVTRCFGNVCYVYVFDSNDRLIEIRRDLLIEQ